MSLTQKAGGVSKNESHRIKRKLTYPNVSSRMRRMLTYAGRRREQDLLGRQQAQAQCSDEVLTLLALLVHEYKY